MYKAKKKILGGREYMVRGSTIEREGIHVVFKSYTTTNGKVTIENGKVTQAVKGATLIGNGPEVMTRISMVGNDLALDSGVGTCGKEGQSVPVGVGQPTLRVDGLTVGGTRMG
jgi:predicted Zn-dependent protease